MKKGSGRIAALRGKSRRGFRYPVATAAFVVTLWALLPPAVPARPDGNGIPERRQAIRQTIEHNLHFNVHCWCRGPDERTIRAVMGMVSDADIAVLIDLLADSSIPVRKAAQDTLEELALRYLDVIRPSLTDDDLKRRADLETMRVPALDALRQARAGGSARVGAAAADALIVVGVREDERRRLEIEQRNRAQAKQ